MEETWETTWEKTALELAKPNGLKNFRRKVSRILEGSRSCKNWNAICQRNNVPIEWRVDTLIGNPWKTFPTEHSTLETPHSLRCAYFLARILSHWPATYPTKVLEVGAGFGGLAERLCRFANITKYYFIDGPPMLKLQKYYMTEAGFKNKCVFEPPTEEVDLIISTLSLGEMSSEELTKYIELFERVLIPHSGLLFLIQHKDDDILMLKGKPITVRIGFNKYPFKLNWEFETAHYPPQKGEKIIEIFGTLKD